MFEKLGLSGITSWIPKIPVKIPVIKKQLKPFKELINWDETRAYGDNYGVNINLKGREYKGIVSPGQEYERLADSLIHELNYLRDNFSSGTIVEQVFKKEDIYNGPCINEGTDIIPLFKDGYFLSPQLGHNVTFDRIQNFYPSGHHVHNLSSQRGILIMKGDAIDKNSALTEPGIIDLAPTILYLMGLPVPGEMEGRVINEAIRPEYLNACPIVLKKSENDGGKPVERQSVILSEEETEAVKDQLRNLGYL